jgi:hypothetical protein
VHESAGGDRHAEALAKEHGNFAQRQPKLFVQHDRERDGRGPQLRARGADRVRRLERVGALYTSSAIRTPADGDGERAHNGPDVWQILLVLRRVARRRQSTTTIGTTRRQRRRIVLLYVGRDGSMRLPTIRSTRLPPWPVWSATRRAARERRRLSVQRAPRIIQFVFEPVNLLPKAPAFLAAAITLAFQLALQALVFALLAFEFGYQCLARCRAPARLHALVMPRPDRKYKRKERRSRRSDPEPRVMTR